MGALSQEQGAGLEAFLDDQCDWLRRAGVADVRRVKAPLNKVRKGPRKGFFVCVHSGEPHVDYQGTLRVPGLPWSVGVSFDAKSSDCATSFPFGDVLDSQVRFLRSKAQAGALAFLYVRSTHGTAVDYVLPVDGEGAIAGIHHRRSGGVLVADELRRESAPWSHLESQGLVVPVGASWARVVRRLLQEGQWP